MNIFLSLGKANQRLDQTVIRPFLAAPTHLMPSVRAHLSFSTRLRPACRDLVDLDSRLRGNRYLDSCFRRNDGA
jgi:hypothetical protein